MKRYWPHIVRSTEKMVEDYLAKQVKDSSRPDYGRMPSEIIEGKLTIYLLTNAVCLYFCKESRYYKDEKLFDAIKTGLSFIERWQRDDGSLDYPSCNFYSAPDTSFCFRRLYGAWNILEKHAQTEEEKESMIFSAAEQIFLSGNYEKAIAALQSYMKEYPSGKGVPSAEFYLGESYRGLGQKEQACDRYYAVMESGSGSYLELAALRFSELTYSLQRYADSYRGYAFLLEKAVMDENTAVARIGMMRSAYAGRMYAEAVENAAAVEADRRSDEALLTEAEYITAKSYLYMSQRDKALPILHRLSSRPDTDYGAEAAYLLIQDSYDRGDFSDVETRVYAFSESENPQQYWLARSFVVLGDAFAEMGDYEQAKATFESVRDGYNPDRPDDVKDNLDIRIQKLEELMSSGTVTETGTDTL